MKYLSLPIVAIILTGLCACTPQMQPEVRQPAIMLTPQQSGTDALLIGVDAASERVVWASGTNGTVIRTTDGGDTWQARTIPGTDSLQFRDVHAISAQTAYVLSIGEGDASRIYKTTDGGRTWNLQFTSNEPETFFDCMAFWDDRSGLAFSDAVDGHFIIITTKDGGQTWRRAPNDALPPALSGEGSFAASGTCVTTYGDSTAWIGTGNARRPRILRTTDRGRTWQTFPAPLDAGAGAGIASVIFRDLQHGLALGGDITGPATTDSSAAYTSDGGMTWRLVETPPLNGPVYGAAYVPGTGDVVAVGPGGIAYSADEGASWRRVNNITYWGVAFASPQAGWIVGPEGRITRVGIMR